MPPRKKQKTLRDFTLVLSTISNLYEEKGDVGRSRSFSTASTNLCAFADVTNKELDAPLKSSEDFKDVKGVGNSTLEMLDEFIKTGTCSRLDELEGTKQVKLVDKTPKTTTKAEQEKLKCGVGIFREVWVCEDGQWIASNDEGEDYMFAYIKSDKSPLYKDIGEYYLDVCKWRHGFEEAVGEDELLSPEEMLDKWSSPYAGLMMWNTYIPEEKFAFVREATEDDMKRKDWKGDGLKSQSLIKEYEPFVFARNEVTREELRDFVYECPTWTGSLERYVEALKQLYDEEQEFIEAAKSNILTAMKLFPYKDKGYDFKRCPRLDFKRNGFKLIQSRVVRINLDFADILLIHHCDNFDYHSSQPHGRVDIDVLCDGRSSTFSYWRHDNVTEDIRENNETFPDWVVPEVDAEEMKETLWELLEEQTLYRYQMENYSES